MYNKYTKSLRIPIIKDKKKLSLMYRTIKDIIRTEDEVCKHRHTWYAYTLLHKINPQILGDIIKEK